MWIRGVQLKQTFWKKRGSSVFRCGMIKIEIVITILPPKMFTSRLACSSAYRITVCKQSRRRSISSEFAELHKKNADKEPRVLLETCPSSSNLSDNSQQLKNYELSKALGDAYLDDFNLSDSTSKHDLKDMDHMTLLSAFDIEQSDPDTIMDEDVVLNEILTDIANIRLKSTGIILEPVSGVRLGARGQPALPPPRTYKKPADSRRTIRKLLVDLS